MSPSCSGRLCGQRRDADPVRRASSRTCSWSGRGSFDTGSATFAKMPPFPISDGGLRMPLLSPTTVSRGVPLTTVISTTLSKSFDSRPGASVQPVGNGFVTSTAIGIELPRLANSAGHGLDDQHIELPVGAVHDDAVISSRSDWNDIVATIETDRRIDMKKRSRGDMDCAGHRSYSPERSPPRRDSSMILISVVSGEGERDRPSGLSIGDRRQENLAINNIAAPRVCLRGWDCRWHRRISAAGSAHPTKLNIRRPALDRGVYFTSYVCTASDAATGAVALHECSNGGSRNGGKRCAPCLARRSRSRVVCAARSSPFTATPRGAPANGVTGNTVAGLLMRNFASRQYSASTPQKSAVFGSSATSIHLF